MGGGFGRENLPYGVDDAGHVVVAYGDSAIDLSLARGLDVGPDVWSSGSLNAFFHLGPDAWTHTRAQLRGCVDDQPSASRRPLGSVHLVLPFEVGDYVDFYASREHASHMGRLLRPGSDPLPPAWLHLPIGYHGRSGTVVVSGSRVPRPSGLVATPDGPAFLPCRRLDVEVELGFVIGLGVPRGTSLIASEAERHVFGVVLVNDWSARDIQAFEYQPLGPFLGKSFATSVSPWVVPLEALEPWRVPGPPQDPPPASYLQASEPRNLGVRLELSINGSPVSETSSAGLYWSMGQQLAHLTGGGSGARPGDLFASGTISGPERGSEGSLMEATEAGTQPVALPEGGSRLWLEDGDTVTITGWCGTRGGQGWLSLGEVTGTVVSSRHEEVP